METIITFHNSKWFYPIWALFFTLSLMLIWWRRKSWQKGYDSFFWLVIGATVIIYCPLLASILVPRFLPSWGEYERLAWIFFEIPILVYVVIKLSEDLKTKKSRCLFLLAILAILILFGSPDNRNYFTKPQNKYKISQDAVTICDKIDQLEPEGKQNLCIMLDSSDAYHSGNGLGGALYYGIRSYSSRFPLTYITVSPEEYLQDNYIMSVKIPSDTAYFVCPKADTVYRELERLGYAYIDESENYSIFKKL